ncbi:MAG: NAD-dependent epimerase/dehydratase family protein [Weeksellaceae bacterium]
MVLVTGATGLVGSFLLLELSKRGKQIRAIRRKETSTDAVRKLFQEFSNLEQFEEIEWVEADLLDVPSLEKALKAIETIYHTAAFVSFDARLNREIYNANVKGTRQLVNVAIPEKTPNIVYVSSIATLDIGEDESVINETSHWNPEAVHSYYARSKKSAEMEVWRAAEESGMKVLVVKPSVIIGTIDGKRYSENIFKTASRKTAFASEGITGYVDVRDVVFSMVELVEKGNWNQSYILNAGEKSFFEVIAFVRKQWNLKNPVKVSKPMLRFLKNISLVNRIFGGTYLSKASYEALTEESHFSNQKVVDAIGVKFIPINESLAFHAKRYLKMK